MAIPTVPVLVAVIGLLLYAFSSNAKAQEAGRIMFACGMLVLTFMLTKHVMKIG